MSSENIIFYSMYAAVLAAPISLYVRWQTAREKRARDAAANGEIFTDTPRGQHPQIDVTNCIGCQGCTHACPEGRVLGMVGGKAALLHPHKCIGHGLCAEACPVGAISLVRAAPGLRADLPLLTEDYETSVPNLFIAGELGGLALIKNAVNQGREVVDVIASRLSSKSAAPGVHDVIIVGAGPAGISASLRAIEHRLNYLTIERDTVGGSVSKYPRQKLVMTSPVEFPLGASLKKMQLSKENLLAFWQQICDRADFRVLVGQTVESIQRGEDGIFTVTTQGGQHRARAVILAMGRAGTPRKLGVKGEDLPKVMYRLLEADHYIHRNILVVGGGDSAIEAAIGLALQPGNLVTLSYRGTAFNRIKERNAKRLKEAQGKGQLQVILNSVPVEFTERTATLNIGGAIRELPNDYVWIFAGGVALNDFLKRIGVEFGSLDVTAAAIQAIA